MKRIDFLGAPGVGKTTLYDTLLRQRKRSNLWLTPEEAKLFIAQRYVRSNLRSLKELIRFLILHTARIRPLQKKLSENIYVSLADQALKDRLEEWTPFIELCSESLGDDRKPPFYRFLTARWFLSQLEDVALVESVDANYHVIFDDSLSQRATGLMPWNLSLVDKQSRKYFNLMPPPDAVVFLRAEPEQITERIIDRKGQKSIVQHQGLSKNDLLERSKIATRIVDIGAETLQKKGIPILRMDALLPVRDLALATDQFINNN